MRAPPIFLLLLSKLYEMHVLVVLLVTLVGGAYGEHFYMGGFKNMNNNTTTTNLTLLIARDGNSPTDITVETTEQLVHSVTVPGQSSLELTLPSDLIVLNDSYSQRHKGIHIQSTRDISVTMLSQNGNSSDAYQIYPIPLNELIDNYIYYAITPSGINYNLMYSSQILLVATDNDTLITIKPTQGVNINNDLQDVRDNVISVQSDAVYTGTLHRLQTLLLGSLEGDLTGTQVTSTKPLVVLSGHECAQFETGSCSFIAEQIPPTSVWGRTFILSPLSLNTSQDYFVLSSKSNTSIKHVCTNGSTEEITLSEGHWYITTTTTAVVCSIQSSAPLLIASVYTGNHPLMTLVPPEGQYKTNVSLSAFSCATKTSAMVLFNGTDQTDIGNNNNNNNNSSPILISDTGSVLYLTFESILNVALQDSRVGVIVYNTDDLFECQFAYTVGWNLTQQFIATSTFTFASSSYVVSEDEGFVTIFINRTNNLDEQTSVTVITTTTNSTSDDTDFDALNEVITFNVGETSKSVRINITNDEWVEPQESFKVDLFSFHNPIAPYTQTTITVLDNDILIVGLRSIIYQPDTRLLSIEVGVNEGVLAPDVHFIVLIKLQEKTLLDMVKFTYEVVRHIIIVNLSRNDICNDINTAVSCVITSELVLTETSTINVSLNSSRLNGTLSDFTNLIEELCNFVIGEFTQQSLVIASSVTGSLVLVAVLATAVGIIGCGLSYHTRRKWTLGGGLNKLYFQDDAMSLATNDPESYELMNRLGEKKTATLAINDDNEYTMVM